MGMFDHVVVKSPLPDDRPDWVKADGHYFQTKDLDSCLNTYTITKEGRLLIRQQNGTGDKDTDYHGDIVIYDGRPFGKKVAWYEVKARFTHGNLEWIKTERREDVSVELDEKEPA